MEDLEFHHVKTDDTYVCRDISGEVIFRAAKEGVGKEEVADRQWVLRNAKGDFLDCAPFRYDLFGRAHRYRPKGKLTKL